MKLIYGNGEGFVATDAGAWSITAKPELGFSYLGLFFNADTGAAVHLREGGQGPMTPEEIALTLEYLRNLPPPVYSPPSATEILLTLKSEAEAAIQTLLDSTARTRGYDSMLSLCTYASSSNPTFAAEAAAGMDWRDAVWTYAGTMLAAIQSGARTVPTLEAFLSELPAIGW